MSVKVTGAPIRVETRIASNGTIQERLSPGYERLKPGPGQRPEQVRANQQARIHRAMVELAANSGYEHVTIRGLIRAAGVSSRTFYLHFANRDECLASTVDSVGRRLLCRAVRRSTGEVDWQSQVVASLSSLLADLGNEPEAARVLLVEALAGGRSSRTHVADLTSDLERLFAHLLASAPVAPAPPHRLVVGIAAGVVRVATITTLTGRTSELPALAPELAEWLFELYAEPTITLFRSPERRSGRGERREPQPFPAELSALQGLGEGERILAAAAKLAAGGGPTALTSSRIRREAGVSRRSFDARFSNATDCFLATVECLARTAASKADAWAIGTRAKGPLNGRTILALCAIVARNESHAQMVLEGILVPGRDGLLLRERLISEAAERLSQSGRLGSRFGALAAEASTAATWRIAQREVLAGRARRLPRYASLLTSLFG